MVLEEIILINTDIINKAKKSVIFPNKCQIIASIFEFIDNSISNFDPNGEIGPNEQAKLKEYLNNISNMIDILYDHQNFWTFLHSKQPIQQIITNINNNMRKINHLLNKLGIKGSFKLPQDDLYQDYGHIDDFLSSTLHMIQERREEVQKNLKQTQKATLMTSTDLNEDNLDELKKYPKYHLKKSDFQITSNKLVDSNTVFDYYKGKLTQNNQNVTILKMRDTSIFKRLLTVLTMIKHPYVESFKGAYIKGSKIKIITNRDGEKLSKLLYMNDSLSKSGIEKGDRTLLAFKIAQAMSYLHSRNIIHRNLNASNIFVIKKLNSQKVLEIKPTVVGFRHSRIIPNENKKFMTSLSIDVKVPVSYFSAPELDDGEYNEKVDVFSFAGILYELLEGHPPFKDCLRQEVKEKLKKGERPILTKKVSKPLEKLIKDCWSQYPNERPSFDIIIKEMIEKKIIFESDAEMIEKITEFYSKSSTKSSIKKKCLDSFEIIKNFIGEATQFRFEFLRIRPILNSYQYLLRTPSYSFNDSMEDDDFLNEEILFKEDEQISEEEDEKLQNLYSNLIKLQSIIHLFNKDEFDSYLIEASSTQLKSKKVSEYDYSQIPAKIKQTMDKIHLSMVNLGFKNIEKYSEIPDDLVYDFRELKCLLNEFYDQEEDTNVFEEQIEDIEEFMKSKNLNTTVSKESFNNRLKDLFSPFKEFEVNRDDFEVEFSEDSPKGATAQVHKGINKKTKEIVAVKELSNYAKQGEIELTLLRTEIGNLTRLKHIYIAEFVGFSLSDKDNSVWFIFKYYEDGLLSDYIHQIGAKKLSGDDLTKIAFKIAKAMTFIHSKHILHHDLKPNNIMMDGMDPKIIDFGYSGYDNEALNNDFRAGTLNYMAPEIVRSEKYNAKSDVFSFAMILYEMWSEELPFGDLEDDEITELILNKFRLDFKSKPIQKALKKLIENCWDDDQNVRPSFKDIMARMINETVMFPGADEVNMKKFYEEESKKISELILKIERSFSSGKL